MNVAEKGHRREHASKRLLEAAGYTVLREAGSHGLWDLVAISPGDILLVQVESRDWLSRQECRLLEAFKPSPSCREIVHMRELAMQACPCPISLPAPFPESACVFFPTLSCAIGPSVEKAPLPGPAIVACFLTDLLPDLRPSLMWG